MRHSIKCFLPQCQRFVTLSMVLIFIHFSPIVFADTVKIPVSKQPFADKKTAIPIAGASKSQVERNFGNPTRKFQPVGQPPITRWDYGQFTVYFEYDLVLHTVINFKPQLPSAPSTKETR